MPLGAPGWRGGIMGGMPPGGGPAEGGPGIMRPGIGWLGPMGPGWWRGEIYWGGVQQLKYPPSYIQPHIVRVGLAVTLTCLSRVVGGHRVVTHRRVAGVHGTSVWGSPMVGHWRSVVWLGTSRVHAQWRGSRVGPRTRSLSLSLGSGGCGSSCRGLLLHLLPRLHLGVSELLHVKRLALGEQLLALQLQLQRDDMRTR